MNGIAVLVDADACPVVKSVEKTGAFDMLCHTDIRVGLQQVVNGIGSAFARGYYQKVGSVQRRFSHKRSLSSFKHLHNRYADIP